MFYPKEGSTRHKDRIIPLEACVTFCQGKANPPFQKRNYPRFVTMFRGLSENFGYACIF